MDTNEAVAYFSWKSSQILIATVVVALTGLLISTLSQGTFIRRGRRRLPPGPRGWPVLGSLLALTDPPYQALFELSKRYGPLMYMRLGSIGTLVVSNQHMAKEVLQTKDQMFASRPHLLVASYLSYGEKDVVFAPYGAHWRQARKICTLQLLTASKITYFSGIIGLEIMATVHSVLETTQSGKSVDMTSMFRNMLMNNMTQMMWNRKYFNTSSSQSNTESDVDSFGDIVKTVIEINTTNNIADFLPCFKSLAFKLTGLQARAKDAHAKLDNFFESVISERERASSPMKMDTTDDVDDFVNILLKLKENSADSQGLSREIIKAILTDMLLGGIDTSGTTLDWALAELMKNPTLMRKAQDELITVVGTDRIVKESDLPNLKYLGAVVKETLRRHTPVILGAPRLSMDDCEIEGFHVPKNTMVFVNYFAIHQDTEAWEKPMEFNPERFLQCDKDYKGHNFDFLPFSSGRRMCPGIGLASFVLHLTLAQLLHTINWSLPDNLTPEDVDMTEHLGIVVARARPLLLRGEPRLASRVIYPGTA